MLGNQVLYRQVINLSISLQPYMKHQMVRFLIDFDPLERQRCKPSAMSFKMVCSAHIGKPYSISTL